MRGFWCLLVTSAIVTACGSSSSRPATAPQLEPARIAPVPAPVPVIDVRPLTITFQGNPIARLFADGRTESVGPNAPGENATFIPGPTLRSDGKIVLTKGGFAARVDKDGVIYVVSPPGQSPPEQRFGHISGNELLFAESETAGVRIDNATLMYGPPTHNVLGKIEGRVDAGARHTALVMTAAFLIDSAITTK